MSARAVRYNTSAVGGAASDKAIFAQKGAILGVEASLAGRSYSTEVKRPAPAPIR